MMSLIHIFIHLLFIGFISLFPVVNPLGSAFIISPYLAHLDKKEKQTAVGKIAVYSFFICTISLFAGRYIMELFGISIPIVQLAGGIMICKMGWEFLSSDEDNTDVEQSAEIVQVPHSGYKFVEKKLFYPITFPITTGAGTISVLITLSAHSAADSKEEYIVNIAAVMVAILAICILVYLFFLNTKKIMEYLGPKGEIILGRITAFLIFCVGLQIAVSGITTLIHSLK